MRKKKPWGLYLRIFYTKALIHTLYDWSYHRPFSDPILARRA